MRRRFFMRQAGLVAVLLLFSGWVWGQGDEAKMDSILGSLPDVRIVSRTVGYSPYRLEYQLAIRQPMDHGDPAKGYLYQQLHLIHRGLDRPMVMETQGYNGRSRGNELEKMLSCNDLDVEFRYFNLSKPDSLRWEYCNFEQATADLHHINQVFRGVYRQKWISTGISRGGETALTYRFFYPADVDATVAYVAPMPNDIEDKRIYAFLDTAGGPEYAARIRKVQIFMLQHEKEALARVSPAARKLHYKTLGGMGAAFEISVLEYPFSFWQVSDIDPKQIPTNENLDDYYNHLVDALNGDVAGFSDEEAVEPFLPHAYMTYQTGYYKYDLGPFRPYLHYLGGANPTAAFLPADVPRHPFDPAFEKKVSGWLASKGDNILYIYGSRDTWTACRQELEPGVKARLFLVPGANHGKARVRFMPQEMQGQFVAALEQMTGLKADPGALK